MKRNNLVKIVVSMLLIVCVSGVVSAANYDEDEFEWIYDITFSNDNMNVVLYFGESKTASDGLDEFDVPMPPCPPDPYLYGFFYCGLPVPYNKLMYDIKEYPDDAKTWNLTVRSSDDCVVLVSWDKVKDSEYRTVLLKDLETGSVVDMVHSDGYEFYLGSGGYYYFQVVCSNLVKGVTRSLKIKF